MGTRTRSAGDIATEVVTAIDAAREAKNYKDLAIRVVERAIEHDRRMLSLRLGSVLDDEAWATEDLAELPVEARRAMRQSLHGLRDKLKSLFE